jgi:rhamnosyltransferase
VKICSVIVGYRPDQHRLLTLCESLVADGSSVVIVDNTESSYLDEAVFSDQCRVIALGANTGIAHAQNVGVKVAIADGAGVIAFFDQDSTVSVGVLRTLVSYLEIGTPNLVSPLCIDDFTGSELPSQRVSKCGLPVATYRGNNSAPYDVDVVISSGIAATREVFEVAGPLDEGLFIDFVDTEWCLRCRGRGISIRVVPAAVMTHRIGVKSIRLWRFTVSEHSPDRCYYQIRNCFHLFRRPHVPLLFALKETLSTFMSRVLLLLFHVRRLHYFSAYLAATKDGLAGVLGQKPK